MTSRVLSFAALLFSSVIAAPAFAAEEPAGVDPAVYEQTVAQAINYLKKTQADDGSYSARNGPGVTGLVATALLKHGRTPQDPLVAKCLKYLEGFVRDDGGVYMEGTSYRNYETCIAILAFTEANRDGRYDKIIERADKFVKGIQWDDEDGHDKASTSYGGAGYGKHKRPDLNNTTFLIEALKAAGNGPDDPAMQRALIFVSRTQNLETEHNTTPFAAKNPDGGFYYTPAAGGESQAGKTPGGGLRSYGSMTYAGLKSMIYAGVGPDDPRVKAAFKWVERNYSLDENPGMGPTGLYYYYHTFAKALAAMNEEVIEADGKKHNWRAELVAELARRQHPDGSWTNEADRWLEGDPNLVSAYCLMALSYCKPETTP